MLIKPNPDDYPQFYRDYVNSVPDENIIGYLEDQLKEIEKLFNSVPAEKENYNYAPGKWSVKEVLGHLADWERILSTRALIFARDTEADFPQLDHDVIMNAAGFNNYSINELLKLFEINRRATILLFKSFRDEHWERKGLSGGNRFTAKSKPYIIAGHVKHHLAVLKEKYLH